MVALHIRSSTDVSYLEIVEDRDLEVGLLALWHLALSVHVPRCSHDSTQIWPPLQNLIVHSHGTTPAARTARLSILQAQQGCSSGTNTSLTRLNLHALHLSSKATLRPSHVSATLHSLSVKL